MKSFLVFNTEGPFWRFMWTAGDIVIVNALFLLTSLPIVTMGASTTALYAVMFQIRRKKESHVSRDYWRAFRENLGASTLLWLPLLLFITAFILNLNLFLNMDGDNRVFLILLAVSGFFVGITGLYVFPVQAMFRDTFTGVLRTSFLMSILRFPWTLAVAVFAVGCVMLSIATSLTIYVSIVVWALFGFGLLAYVNSGLFLQAFKPYLPPESEDGEGK